MSRLDPRSGQAPLTHRPNQSEASGSSTYVPGRRTPRLRTDHDLPDRPKTAFQPHMPSANHPVTHKVRPGAVLLLTALCLAALLAPFPEYWDLRKSYELIRRDREQTALDEQSIRRAAAERNRADQARRAARVRGRVSGSIQGLFDGFVTDLVQQPDGKIVVVGLHNSDGIGVARLNIDGSLDQEFVRHANWELATQVTGLPEQIALAPDGKVLIAGHLYLRRAPRALLRFHADGTLDASFLETTGVLPPVPWYRSPRVAIQPDGAVVFVEFGHPYGPPLRLRSDGMLDRGWDPAASGLLWGQPIIGADRRLVPRPPGFLEPARVRVGEVSIGPGMTDRTLRTEGAAEALGQIQYLGVQPDGRTLVVRQRQVVVHVEDPPLDEGFVFVGDDPAPLESHLIRVDADGTFEELRLGASLCGGRNQVFDVWAVAFQPDGGAVVAGDLPLRQTGAKDDCEQFTIWRITPSGALDPRFRKTARRELVHVPDATKPDQWNATMVHKILVLDNGGIVIGGAFTSVQGHSRLHLARLRPDGSVE